MKSEKEGEKKSEIMYVSRLLCKRTRAAEKGREKIKFMNF